MFSRVHIHRTAIRQLQTLSSPSGMSWPRSYAATDQSSALSPTRDVEKKRGCKRPTSPTHVPRTSAPEQEMYVLSFLTSKDLHRAMTDLRTKYFPPKLNRLDAHLTLFHALPGSRLKDEITPVLEETAASTCSFRLQATTPFKLHRGIAISVPKSTGGDDARDVHGRLRAKWIEFLSSQDAGGFAAHYTIMNKVAREEDVDRAFAEIQSKWQPYHGYVLGFSLWCYDHSRWVWQRDFPFLKPTAS